MNFDKEKVIAKLLTFKDLKVAVIGDLAIDEMVYGDCERISREAPVLILQHSNTKIILGGASNAAHNISKLNGGNVKVIGICGDDYYQSILKEAFFDAKVNCDNLVVDKSHKTIVKTRISGSCSNSITQQIVRIDRQTNRFVDGNIEKQLIERIDSVISQVDVVILSDYHICTLTDKIIEFTIKKAKKEDKIVVVDAQKDFERYKGAYALTPNQPDSEKFLGYFINDEQSLLKAGQQLQKKIQSQLALITLGENGMAIFDKDCNMTTIPAYNKTKVFDVTGAGDTVVATFSLCLASGLTPLESTIVSNVAASLVIREFGCATTSVCDLISNIKLLNI